MKNREGSIHELHIAAHTDTAARGHAVPPLTTAHPTSSPASDAQRTAAPPLARRIDECDGVAVSTERRAKEEEHKIFNIISQ